MKKCILTGMMVMFSSVWMAQAGPNVKVVNTEGLDAVVKIYADDGDDADDKWSIESEASGNDLTINNGAVEVMNITTTGVVTLPAGGTLPAGNIIGNTPLAGITNALSTAGSTIGGNIPVADLTNAAGALGPSIGGNTPLAAITNALGTGGSTIGGNIPKAAITNALGTAGATIGGNVPDAALTNAISDIFGGLTVSTAPVSVTTATITVQCLDVNGNTLAATKIFPFWFSTAAVGTVPSTNGIESFVYVAHGAIKSYWGTAPSVIYIGQSHTDGTMDFLVTSDVAGWTNQFSALSGNGGYTNLTVIYKAP